MHGAMNLRRLAGVLLVGMGACVDFDPARSVSAAMPTRIVLSNDVDAVLRGYLARLESTGRA